MISQNCFLMSCVFKVKSKELLDFPVVFLMGHQGIYSLVDRSTT